MGLKIWLPLNGDLTNLGILELPTPTFNDLTYEAGKIGQCGKGRVGWHLSKEILDNQWTVATWIKCTDTFSQYNNVLFSKNIKTTSDCQIYLSIISNNRLNIGVNGPYSTLTYDYNFSTNTWYHIAATYDGLNISLYINGKLVKSGTTTTAQPSNTFNIQINGRSTNDDGTGSYTMPYMNYNDFRLYDECLSAAQVHEIAKGLVLHYKLDNNGMGNRNLALNSRTFSNWTVGSGWTHSTENGATVYHYERTGSTSTSWNRLIPPLQLNPENYLNGITVSFDFKCDDVSAIDHKCLGALQVYRADNVRVGWYEPVWDLSQVTDNKWIRLSRHFTYSVLKINNDSRYPNAEIAYTTFSFQLCRNGSIYIKNVKIEDGAVATPYFVAPEDLSIDTTVVTDSSGYGHHGWQVNTQTAASPRYSIATVCNGTTVDKTSSTLTGAAYFFGKLSMPASSALTVAWWGKNDTYGRGGIFETTSTIFTATTGMNGTDYNTTAIANWDSTFRIYNGSSNVNIFSSFIKDGAWHHHAIVFDGAHVYYYCDGNLKTSGALTGTLPAFNGIRMGLGRAGGIYRQIEESVSDLRIYCTPLLDTDIKLLYNVGSRIDNLGGIHTYEANENDTNVRSKVLKTGQLQSKNIYEQTALLNNAISASYNSNGNNNSCLPYVLWADFTPFYQLGQSIRVKVEADIAWSNITPTGSGTFKSRLQGGNYIAETNTWGWTTSPTQVLSNYDFTSLMTANATGSVHVSYERTVTAAWLEQNLRSQFGLRTDYATGTISISNLKITLIPGTAKINPNYVSGTEIIEM